MGIVCRGLGGEVIPNHAFTDQLIDAIRPFASREVLIGLDPLRLAIVGSQNDDDGADVVVHTLNHVASALPDCALVVPSHTTKSSAMQRNRPGAGRADASYATAGSALYSQHARSNFEMARMSAEEAHKRFGSDEVSRDEIEQERIVQLTHGRLSHGPESRPRFYVMRGGVLVPIRPSNEELSLAERARRALPAIQTVMLELSRNGHRVSRSSLEEPAAIGRSRDERRKLIGECVTQGWLRETGATRNKAIEFTDSGRAQFALTGNGGNGRAGG
jgi:hypothetical protein